MSFIIKLFLVIGLLVGIIFFPFFRCVLFHPISVTSYGCYDIFHYLHYKLYNKCPDGDIVGKVRVYTALTDKVFGCGKTLSMVMQCHSIYDRYNDKVFYDSKRKTFVTQKVVIVSNVNFTDIPYIKLESLKQITDLAHQFYDYDRDNNTYTILVCAIDEIGVMLNSRNFKTNIDPFFLNTLLTCRKYHIALYGTSQRFSMIDALFRQVTQEVVCCKKIWRLQGLWCYDGYELENCTNPLLVNPIGRACKFIRNKHYHYYDTYAMVEQLELHQAKGDFLSCEEIHNSISSDMTDTVTKYSRLARKRRFSKHS